MDANHQHTFSDWFDVLAVTHRLQATEDQRSRMKAEYFDVLRPYPIEAVAGSYESLRRKMKKWPVPADWLENLPPFASVARLPLLTPEEIVEHDEAERLGYEQPSICTCPRCTAADCHMPPRYVPRVGLDGQPIERRHPTRQGRPALLGEWLHGDRLRRWYSVRADFYALKAKMDAALKAERARPKSFEERVDRLTKRARIIAADQTGGIKEQAS